VLAAGECTVRWITDQYFSPNLTSEEMRALVRTQNHDPLRQFGEACRAELKRMRQAI
jgi:hypothetical protein